MTTGNAEQDFILRESLGITNIGKSILELPTTIQNFEELY